MGSSRRYRVLFLLMALVLAAYSGGSDSANPEAEAAIAAGEELAVNSASAPLTQGQLMNLAAALAVGTDFDGEPVVVNDDRLRTLATMHIRSTALVDFLLEQEDETFQLASLADPAINSINEAIAAGEINPLEPDSVEFAALVNIVLSDQGSNPLRAERDPATGESVVATNPFTNSFVFDPNLARNFQTVQPGFLSSFDEPFRDFTVGVEVAADLGVWNPETFAIDAPG